ncbi:Retrovirus-related Pol polyprotein from transposon RE1 [Vitis vinifera]|uniref:Retrovirus-related Pol polyprotein from transposon RE1 n=1 Tax=Vitis vinifera TaxID=29760 RepID=A0A438F504_VITVI|nr:Retrovirus-related Pol polyprotein from transposon RE1 [Vitis vinifera]
MSLKFSYRNIPCIFLGYNPSTKVFAVLIPPPLSFISPVMLKLMNTTFTPEMAPRPNPPLLSIFRISLNQACLILTPSDVTDSLAGPSSPSLESRPPPVASDVAPTPAPPLGSHPMLTRAKVGIFKTRHPANLSVLSSSGLLFALLASTEPKGFKSAVKCPTWLAAMDEEVQALQHNRTWVLVPQPAHTNIVGSKWVFRTKYLPDGSIERLKARLVAKGFTQIPGLDYTDTFNPVIKATIVRVVLSLTVTNRWPLRQFDVKNAFLNGTLTKNVYIG